MTRMRPMLVLLLALAAGAGCAPRTTATLPAAMAQRLDAEGILRRDDDATIRWTHGGARREWDEGVASIVLTPSTFLIHKGPRVLFEVTPANRSRWRVRRDHDRVVVGGSTARAATSWSWRPKDGDAVGWTQAVRAMLKGDAAAPDSTG
jgi:hypothetical protein